LHHTPSEREPRVACKLSPVSRRAFLGLVAGSAAGLSGCCGPLVRAFGSAVGGKPVPQTAPDAPPRPAPRVESEPPAPKAATPPKPAPTKAAPAKKPAPGYTEYNDYSEYVEYTGYDEYYDYVDVPDPQYGDADSSYIEYYDYTDQYGDGEVGYGDTGYLDVGYDDAWKGEGYPDGG
jgi:hypothetical protein